MTSYFLNISRGLINYKDTKAFVGFSYKIYLKENFLALICQPSRRKCLHLETGDRGGGMGVTRPAQDSKIAGKRLWS